MKRTVLVITTSLIVSACAHRPPPLDKDEIYFETKIKQDGTKLFAVSIPSMKQPDGGKGGGVKGSGGRGSRSQEGGGRGGRSGQKDREGASEPSSDSSDRMAKQLYVSLDEKLDETGYCQTGFIEIDTHQTEYRLHLLGECNETASDLDRLDFPTR